MALDFTFMSQGEMDDFADLVESSLMPILTLEEMVGEGEAADFVTQGTDQLGRRMRLRNTVTETPTTGPAGLGFKQATAYLCQTELAVASGWRLTDQSTGERFRVLGNLTDASWPYLQLRCEAWN
jgi:hypothetical protein